jgi:hypothetical protein
MPTLPVDPSTGYWDPGAAIASIVQVGEALHNALFEGTDLKREQHQSRVDACLAVIPEEYAGWAEAVLRNANYVPFGRRIAELTKAAIRAECPSPRMMSNNLAGRSE